MTEYTSIDGEMGFIDIGDLKSFLSGMINHVVDQTWDIYETELKRWNTTKTLLPKEIPTMSMAEIHEKYSKVNNENSIGRARPASG